MGSRGNNANGVTEFQFHKQENKTKWENFRETLYNPSNNTIFGRSPYSWSCLFIFYSLFYIVLAALFAICMQVLLSTLDDRVPKWTLDDSLIGTNPGMGFRPISNRTEEGSLIWYSSKDERTIKKWVTLLDEFLQPYKINQTGKNFQSCDFDKVPRSDHVCTVDLERFGPCSPSNHYGYNGSSPCVYLKLNKIFGWTPEYFTAPEPDMPEDLVKKIQNLPQQSKTQVWISCEGEGPVDKEHVKVFNYYPNRGFPGYYYPFINTENYLSPLIAVQIVNATPNVLISIECRAWAKNIIYRGGDLYREGSVHFEIMHDI